MRQAFDPPAGLWSSDTTFAARGKWSTGSNVRFWMGKAQAIGGWESLTTSLLTGTCRKALGWTDNGGQLNIAFGTHSNLEVWYGGTLYDITPTVAQPPVALGSDPIATTNASSTVVVTQDGHPYAVGDSIKLSGASAVATVTINGTWTITAVTANTWSFVAGSSANATATGGGSSVVSTPQKALSTGAVDGTGTSGYSTGTWSSGTYSSPSTDDYFPRTWSGGAWGQTLLFSPRNGTIYQWSNDTATVAQAVENAPAQITFLQVVPIGGAYQAFAMGCSQESDGVFNPRCIRHCGLTSAVEPGNLNVWNTSNTTTAREYILQGEGRIVGSIMLGSDLMVFTNEGLFRGSYVGSIAEVWDFQQIGSNCGLIGPNACAVLGEYLYWMSPDRQFWMCPMGGFPVPIECPIRLDFLDNLAASQADKIVASTCAQYYEVRWDYPDQRDGSPGVENSRYMCLITQGEDQGAWWGGVMSRTAFVDAGPADSPIGVTSDGHIYWHERGTSADGAALSGYIESADLYLDESRVMWLKGVWPDFTNQLGPVSFTATMRLYPQATEVSSGAMSMVAGAQKVDFRLSGRLARVRLDFNASPSEWRLGKLDLEFEAAGER